MRYVPQDYNIKMHANSALVTPLIIVSKTFLLTAVCAMIFFATSVVWKHVFSMLVAGLHNVCGCCKCLFKSNHLCSLFRQQYFYFLSFSTFLSPYFPVVLSSLPSWCDFSSSSAELLLPRQWCSSFFPFDRNVLVSNRTIWNKIMETHNNKYWSSLCELACCCPLFISELYIFNFTSVTLC